MDTATSPTAARLDVAPLVTAVRRAGGFPSRELPHVSRLSRAFQRAVNRGTISVAQADEICVRILDRHPASVWGRDWWDPAR